MNLDTVFEIECGYGPIYRTGFSCDGRILASAHFSGNVAFWDLQTGKKLSVHNAHDNITVRCLAWAPKDLRIASGDTDGNIIIWDYSPAKLNLRIFRGHSSRVRSVAWSPDGTKLVSGSSDGYVKTWDTKTGKTLNQSKDLLNKDDDEGRPTVHSVKWSPNGKELASCSKNDCIIWSAESYKKKRELKGHTDTVRSVIWSSDGRLFATCSNDRTIIIWDAQTWKVKSHLKLEDPTLPLDTSIFCIHFTPNADFIVSKSTDNSVRIWRLKDEKCLVRIEELCGTGFEANLGGIALHEKVSYMVTLRNNCRNLRVWNLDYDSLSETDDYYFIDQGLRSSVSHVLNIPDPFEPAADVAILSYFGKIIRDKFPEKKVSFQIIQENRSITLRIESNEKDLRQLEYELSEYGKVIMGHKPVESYLDSQLQIIELKSQIQLTKAMNENLRMINEHRNLDVNRIFKLLNRTIELSQRPNVTFSLTPSDDRNLDTVLKNVKENLEIFNDSYHDKDKKDTDINHIAKIIESDLDKGFEMLKEATTSKDNLGFELVAIINRYQRNKKSFNNGEIKYEDYDLVLNKIVNSVFEIVKSL